MRSKQGALVCDRCGHPAAYREHHPMGTDDLCEVCAHVDHGDRQGSRFALAETFTALANMAQCYGLTADDLHRCVDEAARMVGQDERIVCDIPYLDTLAQDRASQRTWLGRLEALGAETVQ